MQATGSTGGLDWKDILHFLQVDLNSRNPQKVGSKPERHSALTSEQRRRSVTFCGKGGAKRTLLRRGRGLQKRCIFGRVRERFEKQKPKTRDLACRGSKTKKTNEIRLFGLVETWGLEPKTSRM